MSDWASVIIVILIIGIVLDGIRRARNSRKGEIRLSKNARKVDEIFEKQGEKDFSSELPSGGARLKQGRESIEVAQPEPVTSPVEPVQTSLELEEPVPMLMDSVEAEAPAVNTTTNDPLLDESSEPSIGNLDDIDTIVESDALSAVKETKPSNPKPKKTSLFESLSESLQNVSSSLEGDEPEPKVEEDPQPQEILIMNVIAKGGERIPGADLLEVFSNEKLKYGQMGIFHRHLDDDGDAPVIYSIANIIEPGSFDLADIKNSETPGVCVFLSLPCAGGAIAAYDDMVNTTRRLAEKLHCELSDENRSILTKQAIEHGRQKVVEFERKTKLKNQK